MSGCGLILTYAGVAARVQAVGYNPYMDDQCDVGQGGSAGSSSSSCQSCPCGFGSIVRGAGQGTFCNVDVRWVLLLAYGQVPPGQQS